ncbi:MAG: flagellar hook-basal body complex protein, partial [Chloroflexota bacterium]
MIRAMFTAISSLNNNQKFLDVVSNNLANANTTGYKSSRVLFQDQYAQLMSPGAAPATNVGGINPTEIGLGVKIGYVSPNFVQGMLSSTGRNMDLGIQGDGFFIYGGAQGRRYSREGSMNLDADGVLVDSSTGLRTQGWMATANKIDSTMPTTDITLTTDKTLAKATANINLGGNLTSTSAVGDKATVSIGVYDSLGQLQKANIVFTRSAVVNGPPITNPWAWQIFNTATPPVAGTGTGTVTFDANGQYVSSSVPAPAVSIPGSAGAGAVTPIIDFSKLTALASATSASITSQDGLAAGT